MNARNLPMWLRRAGGLLLMALVTVARPAFGADLATLAADSRRDLDTALAELAELRQAIEREQLPLAQEVATLEQRVLERRAEVQRAQRQQENALVELNALKARARARSDEVRFAESLITEYARAFRTRTHIAEQERLAPVLAEIDRLAVSPDLQAGARLDGRLRLIEASADRLGAAAGGVSFEAKVLAPDGRLLPGKVALAGPVGVFASADGSLVGWVQQELNRADPTAFPLPAEVLEGARSLAQTGQGALAVDPTLGNAIKIASVQEGVWEHILKGGVVMWPILLLAAIAAVIALYKWWQLSRIRLVSTADLQAVLAHLREGAVHRALAHARTIPGPAGELLGTAVEHADEKKEYLEEVLYERMLGSKPKLESLLPFIALTAAAAPLLGLLGTVTGMITTFNMISIFGTGDPKTLSGGISEALITTEYGLYVAIPAVLAHAFLSRKAKGVMGSMEQTAVGFINGIPDRVTTIA